MMVTIQLVIIKWPPSELSDARRFYRLCPIRMPISRAFWRKAPAVRLVSLDISATGVLDRECAFNSRRFSLVHPRHFLRLAVFAILVFLSFFNEWAI
jgi:hypothetical protein